MTTTDTTEARRQQLAAAWAGARDIHDAVRHAEDWPEEWAVIVVDRNGRRQYAATGDRWFTAYRGSAARYPSEEAARRRAEGFRTAVHRRTGRPAHPWITAVDVELVKTRQPS